MMQHRHDHDEDAMFSKKPLGGISCASCEKDLVNLNGKAADYYHWNKMPSRDPSERIARVRKTDCRLDRASQGCYRLFEWIMPIRHRNLDLQGRSPICTFTRETT